MIAGLAGMYIHLMRSTPTYMAGTQVVIDTRQERISPVEEVVSNLAVNNSVVAGEVETIRSNVLIGRVVDRLALVDNPAFDPRLDRGEGWLSRIGRLISGGEPFHIRAAAMPPDALRAMVVQRVQRDMRVTQVGVSYVIRITYENPDPLLARDIANALAEAYVGSLLDNKRDATLRVNTWLSERLVELSAQVETADAAVVAFRTEMVAKTGGSEEVTGQLMAELNSKMVATQAERADAEVRSDQVSYLLERGGTTAVADMVTSPLLETLHRQRSELAAQQAELGSTLGRRHPEMVRITAQIGDIDRSIEAEVRRQIEALQVNVSIARNREQALAAQIAVVSDRLDQIAHASVRLDQLLRTAEATRLVYENFLSRFKETSAQGDFQSPEAQIIEKANLPTAPSSPRVGFSMMIAAVASLSFGIVAAFGRSALRDPVRTADDLREATHLPTLAALPHIARTRGGPTWLERELSGVAPTAFMEGIRSVRARLLEEPEFTRPRVVMVTSSLSGEGKSSICHALIRSLSDVGRKVTLIDMDLRRSDSIRTLGLDENGPDLIDIMSGRKPVASLLSGGMEFSAMLGADILVPRQRSDRAADLISRPEMAEVIGLLRQRYDVVIVNAPPVLNLADTLLLAKHTDATLLVAQSGRTPMRVLRQMLMRLTDAGVPVLGTVLTQVRRHHAAARDVYGYNY